MKKILLLAGVITTSMCAYGAEVGIGVGLLTNAGTIYVPIKASPGFRAEPYLIARRSTNTINQVNTDFTVNNIYGVGLFSVRRPVENVNLLMGGRVAYSNEEHSNSSSASSTSDRRSGYILAPTLGFELFVHKSISIGGEASLTYYRMIGNSTSTFLGTQSTGETIKQTFTGTTTVVTIKYYFN